MKKNLKYLLLVGIISLFPMKSKALTGYFKFECNDTNLRVGRSTKCTLLGKFDSELQGLNFSISKSDEISISNVAIQEPYEVSLHDGLSYGLERSGPTNVEHKIVTFDVKLDSDISNPFVTMYRLDTVGYDDSTFDQEPITINFTNTKSSDNTIKTITVGSKTVNAEAGKSTYKFDVSKSVSKVNISIATNDAGASIIGAGQKDLTEGLNKFTIEIVAENGEKAYYYLEITRLDHEVTPEPSGDDSKDKGSTPSGDSSKKSDKKNKSKNIVNPKTGIYSGINIGLIIILVSAVSYMIIRKEKYFNK